MTPILVTPPAVLPLTLDEVKAHLRVEADHTLEDALLYGYLRAAVGLVEAHTRRALMTQTWDLHLDAFPAAGVAIRLPKAPLQAVNSVAYVDADGATRTWASGDYAVAASSVAARLLPAYGKSWPATRAQAQAVTVRFTAGYGDAPAAVPEEIRVALLMLAMHFYENRAPMNIGSIVNPLPFTVSALLEPFVVPLVA